MLFFDDARDGKYGSCEPVSQMGVLSVHCPNGLQTKAMFTNALEKFKEWDRSPNTIVEWDGAMSSARLLEPSNTRQEGVVKMVNLKRRFGFIKYVDRIAQDVFFPFQ